MKSLIEKYGKKKLGYKVLYTGSLLTPEHAERKDLKITYRDHEIEQVQVLIIKLINTGARPITKSDFDVPISVHLKACKNLLGVNVTDAFPYNMVVSPAVAENSFSLPPLDLEPDDYVTIQATFDGINTGFSLQGQIRGGPAIMPIGDYPRLPATVLGYVLGQAILDKLFFRMNTQTNARGEGDLA